MVKTEFYPAKDDTIHTVFIPLEDTESCAEQLGQYKGRWEMCRNHRIGSTRLWLKWNAGERVVLTGSLRIDGLFFHDEYTVILPLKVDGIDGKTKWLESDKATIHGKISGKHLEAAKLMMADVVSVINLSFSENLTEESMRDVLGDELFDKHFTIKQHSTFEEAVTAMEQE